MKYDKGCRVVTTFDHWTKRNGQPYLLPKGTKLSVMFSFEDRAGIEYIQGFTLDHWLIPAVPTAILSWITTL